MIDQYYFKERLNEYSDQFIVNQNYPLCPDEIYLNSDTTNLQSGGIKKVNIPEGTELNTIKFFGSQYAIYVLWFNINKIYLFWKF